MKKASITIEAAFVIPLMFFILAAMISLTFQVYEKTALPSVAYISLLRGNIGYEKDEKSLKDIIENEYNSLAENRLLFSSGQDRKIEIDDNNLQIRSGRNKKEIISQLIRKRPVEFIRNCRRILEVNKEMQSNK